MPATRWPSPTPAGLRHYRPLRGHHEPGPEILESMGRRPQAASVAPAPGPWAAGHRVRHPPGRLPRSASCTPGAAVSPPVPAPVSATQRQYRRRVRPLRPDPVLVRRCGRVDPEVPGDQYDTGRKVPISCRPSVAICCSGVPAAATRVAIYRSNGQVLEARARRWFGWPVRTAGLQPYAARIVELIRRPDPLKVRGVDGFRSAWNSVAAAARHGRPRP